MPVVTLSASYGAGGSIIGPQVARRLGVAFVDRAIPAAVAQELGISADEADQMSQDASRWWKYFARISTLSDGYAFPVADDQTMTDRELIEQTEAHLNEMAGAGNCVILGHAAAVVLADHPGALHVRLDGSVEGRIQAAMSEHGIDEDTAAAALRKNDRVRAAYVKHLYKRDSASPELYHVVLDTVRLGWERAEQLIVDAARSPAAPVGDRRA